MLQHKPAPDANTKAQPAAPAAAQRDRPMRAAALVAAAAIDKHVACSGHKQLSKQRQLQPKPRQQQVPGVPEPAAPSAGPAVSAARRGSSSLHQPLRQGGQPQQARKRKQADLDGEASSAALPPEGLPAAAAAAAAAASQPTDLVALTAAAPPGNTCDTSEQA